MNVIVTVKCKKGKPIIYHKSGCIYERRIREENKKTLKLKNAEKRPDHCACKYCGGIKGELRVRKDRVKGWERKYNMEFICDEKRNTIYIKTRAGFWKFYFNKDIQKYLLYHRNSFYEGMDNKEAIRGEYHRQRDVEETVSVRKMVEYIGEHDRAKLIIADDYRKLPRKTKKQKEYYKKAERKAERKARSDYYKRLDMLFMKIEQEREKWEGRCG